MSQDLNFDPSNLNDNGNVSCNKQVLDPSSILPIMPFPRSITNMTSSEMKNTYSNTSCDLAVGNQDDEKDIFEDEQCDDMSKSEDASNSICKSDQSVCDTVDKNDCADTETKKVDMTKFDGLQNNVSHIKFDPSDDSMETMSSTATNKQSVINMSNDKNIKLHQSSGKTMSPSKLDENKIVNNSHSKVGLMTLNATKAGMSGLDTNRINAIIDEASKGSKFYEAKAKSQKRIDDQIANLLLQAKSFLPDNVKAAEKEADTILNTEQITADMSRTIVHIDMDAFYAAVHERDDPLLKTKPMAVGSMGMLSTSNYHARKFGVRAGMPGFIAKKLCPELTIIPTDFEKYREVAAIVRGIFQQYDPNYVAMSLDEAYLDLTDCIINYNNESSNSDNVNNRDSLNAAGNEEPLAARLVSQIRSKIKESTNGLTASAGIAPNTLLAKVCSDYNKPNNQYMLKHTEEISHFVNNLPVRKVGGIGNVTEQILAKVLDVKTCGDLYNKRGLILLLFKPATAHFLLRVSLGIGESFLSSKDTPRKSLSSETTFEDTSDPQKLFEICDELSADVAKSLCEDENQPLRGKQVTVKIKTHKFEVKTKVSSLSVHTSSFKTISETARNILKQLMDLSEEKPLKLRLLGVRISGFEEIIPCHPSSQQGIQKYLQKVKKNDPTESSNKLISSSVKNKMVSNNENTTKEKHKVKFICPICSNEVQAENENAFNVHLDACLKASKSNCIAADMPMQPINEYGDADNVTIENENLDYFHDFCAKYQEKEKAEQERKSNLNAFHDMVARTNELDRKRETNYTRKNTQNLKVNAMKGINTINSFFDRGSKYIKESNNHIHKSQDQNILMPNDHGPNFFARSTPATYNKTEIYRSYANKILPRSNLHDNELESCKISSCMVRPINNMSDDVGNMPKIFPFSSSIEKDNSFEITKTDVDLTNNAR